MAGYEGDAAKAKVRNLRARLQAPPVVPTPDDPPGCPGKVGVDDSRASGHVDGARRCGEEPRVAGSGSFNAFDSSGRRLAVLSFFATRALY